MIKTGRPWVILVAALLVLILAYFSFVFGTYALSALETTQRMRCSGCQKNLALAMHNYASEHGRLPPAYVNGPDGKPWHSWRVLILPYIAQGALYAEYRFDEPWNGPNNSKLIGRMPSIFGCPADNRRQPGTTSYLAVVGSQTLWPGSRSPTLEEIVSADGTSNTVLIIETIDSDIVWTEPRDVTMMELFDTQNDRLGPQYASRHWHTVQTSMGSGETRSVKYPLQTREQIHALYTTMTAWGGKPYKGEWLPGEEAHFAQWVKRGELTDPFGVLDW